MSLEISSNADVEEILVALGENLKAYRIGKGLSQEQLAERAGIGPNALSHLETGHGSSLRSFVRVLRTLNLAEGINRLVPGAVLDPLSLNQQAVQRRRVKHRRRKHRHDSASKGPTAGD